MGRATRAILPLANDSIAHLFVVYGNQRATDDRHKLALTNKLLEAVICEARVCGTGQQVVIAGDLNVKPSVIPVTAEALQGGHLVDLEEGPTPPTCRFDLDGAPGTRRDFFLVCPNALAASTGCDVWEDRWFRPHFAVCAQFGVNAWSADVQGVRAVSPLAMLADWNALTDPGILSPSLSRIFGVCTWSCCSLCPSKLGKNCIGPVSRSLMLIAPGVFGARLLKTGGLMLTRLLVVLALMETFPFLVGAQL